MATQANMTVGRRKESVARVRLVPGTGNITINGRTMDVYFGRETSKMILVEPLKLVSNYYGDAMGDLVKALIGSGHRTIAYFGTAGGTGTGVKIGDIHVPSSVYDFRFELASGGVRNAFLDYFAGRSSSLGNRLNLDTKLGNVYSPAEETMAWLEETRTRGISAVEVENSYIILPTAPGLGLELDEEALSRYPYREFPLRRLRQPHDES